MKRMLFDLQRFATNYNYTKNANVNGTSTDK